MWEAMTGKPITVYRGHRGSVNALAWSPDGTSQIVSGGDDTSMHVVDKIKSCQLATFVKGKGTRWVDGWVE